MTFSTSRPAQQGLQAVILVFLAAIVYGRSLHYPFIGWDDYAFFVDDPAVQQFRLGAIWGELRLSVWYPLARMSHAVDYLLFGADPRAARSVNILLHAANAWLLAAVILAACRAAGTAWASRPSHLAAALAAMVFCVHPQHVEAVVWVSQRKELLSTSLSLLAIRLHLGGYAGGASAGRSLAVFACGLGAMLAKPMAVTLPLWLLAMDLMLRAREMTVVALLAAVRRQLPLLLAALAVGLVALYSHDRVQSLGLNDHFPVWLRVQLMVANFIESQVALVWFGGLAPARDFPALVDGGWRGWLLWPGLLLLLAGSLWWIAGRWGLWLLAMVFVAYVPVSGITLFGTYANGDRYSYFSTLPWYAGFAVLLQTLLLRWQRPAVAACVVLLVALSLFSVRQSSMWRDDFLLWYQVVQRHPGNAMSQYYLGDQYRKQGRFPEAIRHMEQSLALGPVFKGYPPFNALGQIPEMHKRMQRPDLALAAYYRAIPYLGNDPQLFAAIGILELVQGNTEASYRYLDKAYAANGAIVDALRQQAGQFRDPVRRQQLNAWLDSKRAAP